MSQVRSLLTRKEKINLIYGYIRQNIGILAYSVLVELVRLFYNNLRSLRVSGSNLREFLYSAKPMVTEMFSINENTPYKNIKFRMGVYPNGLQKNKQDAIEFYIKLKSLQDKYETQKIEKIKIYYELYCQETESEWKGVIRMELNEYIVWSPYIMRISQCKKNKYKALFFSCDITILALYFADGRKTQITKQIRMNKNEKFIWNISNKHKLYTLNNCNHGYCQFSDNFGGDNNDNWCCKYYPEGMKLNDVRGAFFIRLLRKPINIKMLKVRYKIEFNNQLVLEEIQQFSDIQHSNGCWVQKLSEMQRESVAHVKFSVKIDILEIFGYNDKVISCQEWMRYGLSRLKPF